MKAAPSHFPLPTHLPHGWQQCTACDSLMFVTLYGAQLEVAQMIQQCNNPYRREVQQRGAKQGDSSLPLLLLLAAQFSFSLSARGSTNLPTASLKRRTARPDATWKGKKKKKPDQNFTLFCLSLKAAIRSASLVYLSPVQHNSQRILTPEDSEPDLRTQPNHVPAVLSPALLHTFSLSKADTEGSPWFRTSTGNVGICNKHFDFTGPWHRDGTCPTLQSSAKVEQGLQKRFSFPLSEISSCPSAHLSVW